uniref:Uncharacterized protein n=1 Tax=Brassica oleracea var. oleracea TaxID=109376 RepID=A0A0D3AY46_BRAOL
MEVGFDIEHITAPQNTCGLMPYDCENERIRYPNRVLVNLYAKLGLHRYNLSELKDPELQGNDWIRLYLELALCLNDRNISERHVSQLQIVRVAVETSLPVAQVGEDGEHVERKVIVRRFVDLSTTLKGGFGFSVGEDTSEGPMTRLRNMEEICAELRLHPTTRPCPAIPIADYWKS